MIFTPLKRLFWDGLSRKLLLLTILFVMVAEVMLFIPSAALFRQSWINSRIESAQLLTLAVMGVPDYRGSATLNERFMKDADVTAIMQKRDGMTESVMGMAPAGETFTVVDFRTQKLIPDFGATARAYFGNGKGYIRVWAEPSVPGAEALEIIIPNAAVKQALIEYCHRVLGLSALIAIVTGLLIYLVLSAQIVSPLKNLARALSDFRSDPERLAGNITASKRRDEIGQLEREFVDMKSGIRGALKQKDHLATLGLAVAKINHDLRNVLTSAQLISDRLASDSEPRIAKMGERLVRAVDRGVQLCAATLSYSKTATDIPKPQNFALAPLLDEAADDAIAALNMTLTFRNDVPPSAQVFADPDHAYRIFSNLFRNAMRAMKQSGAPTPILQISAKSEAGQMIISVKDNGPGLPQHARENLFKAFSTTATEGTGLGLALSRELAQAHGGDLALQTSSAAGTEFVVVFPDQSAILR